MNSPARQALGLAFVAALAAGCSPSGPEMAEVDGVVLYKGQPLPKVEVQFLPEKGPSSIGETDNQGRFKLQYRDPKSNDMRDGAAVGKHKVLIVDLERPQAAQGENPRPGRIADHFADPSKSKLVQEVRSGKQSVEIKLD